jgi:hypothetical protein
MSLAAAKAGKRIVLEVMEEGELAGAVTLHLDTPLTSRTAATRSRSRLDDINTEQLRHLAALSRDSPMKPLKDADEC